MIDSATTLRAIGKIFGLMGSLATQYANVLLKSSGINTMALGGQARRHRRPRTLPGFPSNRL
jgi:hypothetical protein